MSGASETTAIVVVDASGEEKEKTAEEKAIEDKEKAEIEEKFRTTISSFTDARLLVEHLMTLKHENRWYGQGQVMNRVIAVLIAMRKLNLARDFIENNKGKLTWAQALQQKKSDLVLSAIQNIRDNGELSRVKAAAAHLKIAVEFTPPPLEDVATVALPSLTASATTSTSTDATQGRKRLLEDDESNEVSVAQNHTSRVNSSSNGNGSGKVSKGKAAKAAAAAAAVTDLIAGTEANKGKRARLDSTAEILLLQDDDAVHTSSSGSSSSALPRMSFLGNQQVSAQLLEKQIVSEIEKNDAVKKFYEQKTASDEKEAQIRRLNAFIESDVYKKSLSVAEQRKIINRLVELLAE